MTTRLFLFLGLCLTSFGVALANQPFQEESATKTVFDWLSEAGGEVLEVTLESDWTNLIENRKTDLEITGNFMFEPLNGEAQKLEVDVALRGKFRRRVCAFPPVKIKFPKKELKEKGLKTHNDIKLVTHCMDDKKAGNENVLKEYLAYKLYNELTDNSFRVRLVKITYVDTAKKMPKTKRYGFLIEDTDEMAERLSGEDCDCLYPEVAKVNEALIAQMAMFQYLLGNEDWNLSMGRNLKYVITNGGKEAIPVAYDFDFSGLVNTSYALPNIDYNLQSVEDRIYLGQPVKDEILVKAIEAIRAKREHFFAIIKAFDELNANTKKEMIAYLDTCYELLSELEKAGVQQWYSVLSKGSNTLSIPLNPPAGGAKSMGK
ncbi:MAG: hypothetical protein R2828_28250 [Saprospiraceae bacterium]